MNSMKPWPNPHRSKHRLLLVLLLAVLSSSSGCWSQSNNASSAKDAEAEIRKKDSDALRSIGNRDWFNPAQQEFRPPNVPANADHAVRRDGVTASKNASNSTTRRGIGWWFGSLSGEALGYLILFILGTLLAIAALVLLLLSARSWFGADSDSIHTLNEIAIDPARVADLPFEAQVQMQDPLTYARFLMSSGRYDEAILFLYGYMLLALDRAGKIVLHRGKTNRMYLQELGNDPVIVELLLPAMLAFEEVFFGRHSIDRERFMTIWNSLERFHAVLGPTMAARAVAQAELDSQSIAPEAVTP